MRVDQGSDCDVLIAGAGLAGRLCAWRYARAGRQVRLFDAARRDDTRSASAVAASGQFPGQQSAQQAGAGDSDAQGGHGQVSLVAPTGWIGT